ncbi:MAG: S8 family serine peptidase [Candidatus Thorarchaeota archaeon]
MKRALVLAILVVSIFTMVNPIVQDQDHELAPLLSMNPVQEFVDSGVQNDVSVRFDRELTIEEIEYYQMNGIDFGDSPQHVGSIYLAKASDVALEHLSQDPFLRSAEPLKKQLYQVPRDVSVTETYTDLAWQMQDLSANDLTGEDILIADLDTGINWNHPEFFFADGGNFTYFETAGPTNPNRFIFNNGTDGFDINGNLTIEANEILYLIDLDMNGAETLDVDWLYLDNGTTLGAPDDNDAFFVVDDANSDSYFNNGETMVRLKTPKTKYIVHKPIGGIQVWDRDVNLTSCTFLDTHGHGTSVAGILNGGQRGYRMQVGMAPDAELMAINVFGSDGLTIEEGLIWARDHGADVILIEIGSWTYEFLDGSSNVERMIDELTASGIPVIVPAGNLQACGRHSYFSLTAATPHPEQFSIPSLGSLTSYSAATEMYLTMLSSVPVDNAVVTITEPTSGIAIVHSITLGVGYNNWWLTPTTNVNFDAFLANSTRGMNYMIAIDISGWIYHTSQWTVTVTLPTSGIIHYYIADDATDWSGGAAMATNTDSHIITWPSTADSAISVASYMSRNLWMPGYGYLASYSSIGPRIDGNPKMSIAAPGGLDIISSWSMDAPYPNWYTQGYSGFPLYPKYGGYQLFGGTSAAGPHVAAAAALMLQLNAHCGSVVKNIIEATAYQDGFTGVLPVYPAIAAITQVWGYGKLNVCAAVEQVGYIPVVQEISISPENPEYDDTVTLSMKVINVNSVLFDWSIDDFVHSHVSLLSLSGGYYTATIPAINYGQKVWYRFNPINSSSIANPTIEDTYIVGDTVAPIISSFVHNATAQVVDPTYIEVSVAASDAVNASGISGVVLEVTVDNWVSTNTFPLVSNGTHYNGLIDPFPVPSEVKFLVVVTDNAMNTASTAEVTYTVVEPGLGGLIGDNLYLIIGVGAVVLILIVCIVIRRR